MYSTVDPKMEKPFDEFSASGDSFPPEILSLSNALNKSYTISKDCCYDKKLSVLYEENSECCNDSNMIYLKSFASIADLSECKNMCFADLDSKQISASSGFKTEIGDDIEKYYDSDDSLGILPDLLDDSLNLHKDDLNNNLNTTVNISDKLIENFEDILNYNPKYSSKEFSSAVCNKINISDTQTESPVYRNQCMPKHASTPKHENSSIIDEEIALPQNKILDLYLNNILQDHNEEVKDCLNKTTIVEASPSSIITNIPTSTFLNSDENMNSQQNILNTTYDMTKTINTDKISLNKTFESLPVLADKYVLPSVICDIEQYKINKSNILDKTFELHYSAEFDPDLGKENLLNLTCGLGKGSDTIGTVYGNCSENAKDILNTIVSYPLVHGKTQLTCSLSKNKSNDDEHKFQSRTGDILNSTFGTIESLKYDENSEKLKCITNLEENKLLQLGSKTVIKKRRTISFSAKSVAPEKIEFKNKGAEFDRNKNLRRSLGRIEKNVSRPNPVKQNSRHSNASNICSVTKVPEIKKNLSFPKSLPKYAGNIENKSSLIHEKNVADAFKTAIKKPRKSMQLSSAIESLGSFELPSMNVIKNVIPSLQKKVAVKVPQMRVKEMIQEPKENKTFTLSSKFGFKDSLSVEEKKVSRLPQRTVSQKIKCKSSCQSSSIKPLSNIATSQSTTGIRPPTTGMKSIFTPTKISSNVGSELAGNAISKRAVSSQKSKEQHSETHEKFQNSTKIPTISCFSRQGKNSLLSSKRTGVALCKKSQFDLR